MASERILDVLETFADAATQTAPRWTDHLVGRFAASRRALQKRRNALVPDHKNNSSYTRHRFPGIKVPEVQSLIERFGRTLGRFDSVRAEVLAPNIFRITAARSK